MIPINQPIYGEAEFAAVASVLTSGNLTVSAHSFEGGKNVKRFEDQLKTYTSAKYCSAVNSGTAALEVALLALNITQGDKVIVPSLTFVATANAVESVGAEPIFCDVDGDGLLDYNRCKKLCNKFKIKCIIFVDLYGRIPKDAKRFKDLVPCTIEDACQALGTKGAGTFGDIGCFSFYASKVMTTFGMGGAVITNNAVLDSMCKLRRNQGIYNGQCIKSGRNLLMPEANAAFGCEQLKRMPEFIRARNTNMSLLGLYENTNGYMGTILSPKRDIINRQLHEAGIGSATYYDKPIHCHRYYHGDYDLPMTMRYANEVLNIPVHPNVRPIDTARMTEVLDKHKYSSSF